MSEESVMSYSVRDITESTEAEGRDDTHQSRCLALPWDYPSAIDCPSFKKSLYDTIYTIKIKFKFHLVKTRGHHAREPVLGYCGSS